MARFLNRDFLTRRIDRCYLIAAGARNPEKRKIHLELARYYRRVLSALKVSPQTKAPDWGNPQIVPET